MPQPFKVFLADGWAPDAPPLLQRGLKKATGCIPVGASFKPLGAFVSAGADPLNLFPRGHFPARTLDGVGFNFVGTETKLYEIGPDGLIDRTRLSGPYAAAGSAQWHFAQFGDRVIATSFTDDIQSFVIGVDTDFSQLDAAAPRARVIGFIGPQIVVGNLDDPIFGLVQDGLRSPELGDPTNWPDPSDPNIAAALQAYFSRIEGDGGPIHAIVSGTEVGCVMQERQICRVEYVGGDTIFQIDRIEKTRGLLFPRLYFPFGREVLFLSEDGFFLFDYTSARPIGDEKVDRAFFDDFDQTYASRAIMVKHTRFPVIGISYPGQGNTGGQPNRIIFWNYKRNRWAGPNAIEHSLLARILPPALSLDSDPDDVLEDFEDSFDDAPNPVGSDQFGYYDPSFELGTLSGTGQQAVFETGDLEFVPGRLSRLKAVRPLIDKCEPTLEVAGRNDRRADNDAPVYGSSISLNTKGEWPVRKKARYHRLRMTIPAGGFQEAIGMEIEATPAGRR